MQYGKLGDEGKVCEISSTRYLILDVVGAVDYPSVPRIIYMEAKVILGPGDKGCNPHIPREFIILLAESFDNGLIIGLHRHNIHLIENLIQEIEEVLLLLGSPWG